MEIDLLHLDKLARGASNGPWQCSRGGNVFAGNDLVTECPPCQGHRGKRNAKFIAAMDPITARELIRRTLDAEIELDALAAHVEQLNNEAAMLDEIGHDGVLGNLLQTLADGPSTISLALRDAEVVASLRFPTMLRKIWYGGDVQAWLEEQAEELRRQAEEGP